MKNISTMTREELQALYIEARDAGDARLIAEILQRMEHMPQPLERTYKKASEEDGGGRHPHGIFTTSGEMQTWIEGVSVYKWPGDPRSSIKGQTPKE